MKTEAKPHVWPDILDVFGWYEAQEPGVGLRFVTEVQESVARIGEHPAQFPVVMQSKSGNAIRRSILKHFPYALYFYEGTEGILIFALTHMHRHTDEWKKYAD